MNAEYFKAKGSCKTRKDSFLNLFHARTEKHKKIALMRLPFLCCFSLSIFFFRWLFIILAFFVIPFAFSTESCPIEHAVVSVYAVQCDDGKVLINENSDLSMIPASCMKIVTTAAALHLLGANSRFETHLEYAGWIDKEKTLRGNIYIRGGGDPCLGSNCIMGSPSWKKQIEIWADAIQKLGVRRITGKVIADATKWEKALAVPSWEWEDLGNYYGAGASALSFNENQYSIFFKPANNVGETASILYTDPPLASVLFQNEVKTGAEGSEGDVCIYGSEFSSTQFLRGTIPFGVDEFSVKGVIPDPASFCACLLAQELQKRKVKIENNSLKQEGKRVSFHTTYSPTIKEIVHWINQKSINLYAEHLLKKMGEVAYNEGSTESGIKAVTEFWRSQNIDIEGFNMADGSGLSRKNLITTKQLVEILQKIKKSKFFPIILESLPQKENHMKAKSGTMSLVKGYAGYTNKIVFAVIVNQCPNSQKMNEKINKLLSKLNEFSKNLEK